MARIRSIKPQFWTSEQVAECSPMARLMFIGLWNFCDDYGVHPASLKRLKMEVFPADDVSTEDIRRMVGELLANGLVEEYEIAETRYWRVTGWDRHQRPDTKTGLYPLPDGEIGGRIRRGGGDESEGERRTFGERSPPEKEKEKEKSQHPPASAGQTRGASGKSTTPAPGFDPFWAAWPRKEARQEAVKAWNRLRPDDALQALIVAAVERFAASEAWLREGGQFIPHPATWLNGRRWEDEPPALAGYSAAERAVMAAYATALAGSEWPAVEVVPYLPARAAAIRSFLVSRPVEAQDSDPDGGRYFAWLAENLAARPGFGFDWTIRLETYTRAREGNFAALAEVTA